MKALFVGGTWDKNGGKPSKIFSQFVGGAIEYFSESQVRNGGIYGDLYAGVDCDVAFWMPNVPNDLDMIHPKSRGFLACNETLVCSKAMYERPDREEVTFADALAKMLHMKANLGVLVRKDGNRFTGQIADPLGNTYGAIKDDFNHLGAVAAQRAIFLKGLTRIGSKRIGAIDDFIPIDDGFIKEVREFAGEFAKLLPTPENCDRFLGNASFRCSHGFPSFRLRDHNGERIMVSRRDVDKTGIGLKDFVPVNPYRPYSECVEYYGQNKPSVDTPVELIIFDHFKRVNYLMHGHVYLKDTMVTCRILPCGVIEEWEEIRNLIDQDPAGISAWSKGKFGINLRGHGCLIGVHDVKDLSYFRDRLVARQMPEGVE
jgi:hypothetical protein